MRQLTKEESKWLKRFKRCIKDKPPTLQLHMENVGGDLQVYSGNAHGAYELIDTPSIICFCSEGDALHE